MTISEVGTGDSDCSSGVVLVCVVVVALDLQDGGAVEMQVAAERVATARFAYSHDRGGNRM